MKYKTFFGHVRRLSNPSNMFYFVDGHLAEFMFYFFALVSLWMSVECNQLNVKFIAITSCGPFVVALVASGTI